MAAAAAAALALGVGRGIVARGLESVTGVPGRFERIDEGQPFTVLVDYAHTDDALKNLLLAVRDLRPRRVVTVFGSSRIDGHVTGNVVAVCGSLTLGPRAAVDGDMVAILGRIEDFLYRRRGIALSPL